MAGGGLTSTDDQPLRLGDKADVLPLLAEELPEVALFVYDVPHDCRRAAKGFHLLNPLLPPGGVAIVDHGPGGGLCPALGRWARGRGLRPAQRRGTGLFGMGPGPTRRSGERNGKGPVAPGP